MRIHLLPSLLLATIAALASAKSRPAPPTTSAVTTPLPTTQSLDQSTPKSAIRSLNAAMETGDAIAMSKILYAQAPQEQKMIDAMSALAQATANLHRAAITAFGEAGSKGLTGDTAANATEAATQLDAATEKIESNYATVAIAPEGQPISLLRIDNRWRVPVSQLAKNVDPATVDQRLLEIAGQTSVLTEVAAQITSGKFHSAEDAAETLHAKMWKSAMTHVAPTTAPSTSPVK